MKTTKHFALAALFVLAVAVVLGTAAPAMAGRTKSQYKLSPPADGPFPSASGTVTEYYVTPPPPSTVIVSVSKLAPNTRYYMPVYIIDYRSWWEPGWGWRDEYFEGLAQIVIDTDARGNGTGGMYADLIYIEGGVYDWSTGTLVLQ